MSESKVLGRVERKVSVMLLRWWEKNGRNFPWRSEKDPYKKLIAEIMLQRTRAEQVLKVYPAFISRYPSPQALASADLKEIERFFHRLGLVWRAREIRRLGKELAKLGKVPLHRDELLSLPGVGDYVADAVLATAFDEDVVAVDSNVCRLVCRLFGLEPSGEPRRDLRIKKVAESIMPAGKAREFNWALIDYSALVCRPKPLCVGCLFSKICRYHVSKPAHVR